jgi:hypothetical protein
MQELVRVGVLAMVAMIAHGRLGKDLEQDAFRAGERRVNAKITLAEQGIGASLARLRRELAVIRWMLIGVFAAVSIIPLVMPLVV